MATENEVPSVGEDKVQEKREELKIEKKERPRPVRLTSSLSYKARFSFISFVSAV